MVFMNTFGIITSVSQGLQKEQRGRDTAGSFLSENTHSTLNFKYCSFYTGLEGTVRWPEVQPWALDSCSGLSSVPPRSGPPLALSSTFRGRQVSLHKVAVMLCIGSKPQPAELTPKARGPCAMQLPEPIRCRTVTEIVSNRCSLRGSPWHKKPGEMNYLGLRETQLSMFSWTIQLPQ